MSFRSESPSLRPANRAPAQACLASAAVQYVASATKGEVTEPFRSEFGWHILEVTGRRDKDFSGAIQRSQVANYIREQKYQEELDAWLREIREEAFIDIK